MIGYIFLYFIILNCIPFGLKKESDYISLITGNIDVIILIILMFSKFATLFYFVLIFYRFFIGHFLKENYDPCYYGYNNVRDSFFKYSLNKNRYTYIHVTDVPNKEFGAIIKKLNKSRSRIVLYKFGKIDVLNEYEF